MSGQGYDNSPQGQGESNNFHSNNPYAYSQQPSNGWQQQPSSGPPTGTVAGGAPYSQQYNAPSGPPPGQQPQRAGTFKESDFVPESERGEQREAIEQFEMNRGQQSQEDRDIEILQRDFPGVDGSLIAALYGDCQSVGATREMLQELSGQS